MGKTALVVFKLNASTEGRIDVLPLDEISVTCTSSLLLRVVTTIAAPLVPWATCTSAWGVASEAVTDADWPCSLETVAVIWPCEIATVDAPPNADTTTSADATVTVVSTPVVAMV